MLALLAAVSVTIGALTAITLNRYLMVQLDGKLSEALKVPRGAHPGPGPDYIYGPGNPPGTLGAQIGASGAVTDAGYLGPERNGRPLPQSLWPTLAELPDDGRPHSRDLEELGDYRLLRTTNGQFVVGVPLGEVHSTMVWILVTESALIVAGLVLAALAGDVIVRRTLRPLRRVAATASRVSELRLDRGAVALSERVSEEDTDPRTEVGQVGAAINRMLGHVGAALSARHASETRVRTFVADASHELRTPLAAIRGYAELTRRVDAEVPPDVARAIGRVESEAVRMTGLVDDLLLLARLDSARFDDAGRPLVREPVDLSRLMIDAVGDAHAAGPEHHWRLDVPEESVSVPGDPARLHQVVANLLANASAHTPQGTTVEVGLSVVDGMARLTVADDGPGIPEALQPEVFERFARGDSSRSRAAGSTGLGLAIVAAVVEAHDGTVDVRSRPGRTEFTVTLPISQPTSETTPAA